MNQYHITFVHFYNKQAKMQWLQDQHQSNVDNLSSVRREAIFRKKKRESLKTYINDLEKNSKNKNIRNVYRGIRDFKKGYEPRTNIEEDYKGDLVAYPTVFGVGERITSLRY
jgi:hypothetical protein